MDMAAKVQTPKFENAATETLDLFHSIPFIASSQKFFHYPPTHPSSVLLHTPLTIPPIYNKGLLNKLILV